MRKEVLLNKKLGFGGMIGNGNKAVWLNQSAHPAAIQDFGAVPGH